MDKYWSLWDTMEQKVHIGIEPIDWDKLFSAVEMIGTTRIKDNKYEDKGGIFKHKI